MDIIKDIVVNFLDQKPVQDLFYTVILARYKNQWIFVRNKAKNSWEFPGGHIEFGESTDEAAARELVEESGAISFELTPISYYSVTIDGKTSYGRYYFAEIKEIGDLDPKFEIDEVGFYDSLPKLLTYPEIIPKLFKRGEHFLDGNRKN